MTSQPDPKEQPELYPVTDRLHVLPGLAHSRRERQRARLVMILTSVAIVVLVAVFIVMFR
jgi:hypothetical protein